jgi:type VI secretion system secreted protein Hcp
MATDIHLKLGPNIKGEDNDSEYKNGYVNIDSYSWGITQQGGFNAGTGTGGGAGRSNVQDMHFSKTICLASPDIMIACAKGDHIDWSTLYVRKAGGKPYLYFLFEMTKVIVSSYQTGSGGGGGTLISEQFSLNFEELKLTYWPQAANGGQGTKVEKKYNMSTNTDV